MDIRRNYIYDINRKINVFTKSLLVKNYAQKSFLFFNFPSNRSSGPSNFSVHDSFLNTFQKYSLASCLPISVFEFEKIMIFKFLLFNIRILKDFDLRTIWREIRRKNSPKNEEKLGQHLKLKMPGEWFICDAIYEKLQSWKEMFHTKMSIFSWQCVHNTSTSSTAQSPHRTGFVMSSSS